jgi:hypothetical protein
VFPLTGKVYESPRWAIGLFVATGLFLFVTLCFWRQIKELATLHPAKVSGFLAFEQLLSVLLVNETNWLWTTSFNDWQRVYAVTAILLSTVMAGLLLYRTYKLLTQSIMVNGGAWLYALYMIFVGFALYKTYGMALDGRYTSFHYPTTYIPVIGMIYLMVVGYFMSDCRFSLRLFSLNELMGHNAVHQRQDKVLGYLLLIIAVALLVGETYAYTQGGDLVLAYPESSDLIWRAFMLTVSNGQLMKWFLSLIILAIPLLANGYVKHLMESKTRFGRF